MNLIDQQRLKKKEIEFMKAAETLRKKYAKKKKAL